ncbi:hypothetical protein F5887DRAFT_920940 [Amanita rubescens]|nr:hypothetical protein F5887DRAFT_920940 [Amanita rubescens]
MADLAKKRKETGAPGGRVPKAPKTTGTESVRPKRSTQGKGGFIEQLEKAAAKIVGNPQHKKVLFAIPDTAEVNPLAPQPRPKPRRKKTAGTSQKDAAADTAKPITPPSLGGSTGTQPRSSIRYWNSRSTFVFLYAGCIFSDSRTGAAQATNITIQGQTAIGTGTGFHANYHHSPQFGGVATPTKVGRNEGRRQPPIDPVLLAEDARIANTNRTQYRHPPAYSAKDLGVTAPVVNADRAGTSEEESGDVGDIEGEGDVGGDDQANQGDDEDDDDSSGEGDNGDDNAAGDPGNDGGAYDIEESQMPDHIGDLDFPIDEVSPDEDERQALRALRQPPATADQGGLDVVSDFRERNRAVRPPTLDHLEMSGADFRQQSPQLSEQDESGEDAQRTRAPRHSKTPYKSGRPNPATMGFYTTTDYPGWKTVLDNAKQKFRLQIAIVKPFPAIENHISIAAGCITEAIADFHADNKQFPVDMSVYKKYHRDMAKIMFNDASTFRGRLKDKARIAVKRFFEDTITPPFDVCGQAEYYAIVATNVAETIKSPTFLQGDKDEQGRISNYSHPALKYACQEFFYGTGGSSSDCLYDLFPAEFIDVPIRSLALASTAITHCLDEYSLGYYQKGTFSKLLYESQYMDIMSHLELILADPYHGPKLHRMLKDWAAEARLKRGKPGAAPAKSHFTIVLD